MTVHYCLIAYKQNILAQAGASAKAAAMFSEGIEKTLAQFADKDNMRLSQMANNDCNFFIQIQNGVSCVCFTDKQVQKAQAYGMMADLLQRFSMKYSMETVKFASKLQFDREFSAIIKQDMDNVKHFQSYTAELQKELDETKGLVMDNINAVMKRASQLESIENDAIELRDNAEIFKDSAADLKKKMMCKKVSMIVGICVAVVVVVLIIVLPIVL